MKAQRTIPAAVLVALALGGLATACAKRPAMLQASAPPPTAVATAPTAPPAPVVPAPAPQALAPVAPPPAAPAPAPEPPKPVAVAPAPVVAPPPPAQFKDNAALDDVHFDFDKSAIRPGDARILDTSAGWLRENPKTLVLIEGHADERGTNEYNLALGDRRAQAARAYLAARGIDTRRMTVISYGEERPTCTQRTEACWAQNRRAHFLTKAE